MNNKYWYIVVLTQTVFGSLACISQKSVLKKTEDSPIAFPGAEGYGKYTTGGRGGKVFIVSNLNDKGTGSFREAAEKTGKRTIVFAISGTIHLESKINIRSDVTIAGQTAPGDGICIADQSVVLRGDNIIVRYLRFRLGDKYQRGGMVDGNGGDDAFGGTHRTNIIIDHCTMSWSTDEAFSVYGGDSTTLQWNLISEPLNYSYHYEKGDTGYEHHGYGAIWGGSHSSFHHNLFAHCNSRNPRFDGIRNIPEENCDYRNNVIYDWGGNSVYAGEGGNYNLINNYYKYGPSTSPAVRFRIMTPYKLANIPFGKFYVKGNFVDGWPNVSADNSQGVIFNQGTEDDRRNFLMTHEFSAEPVKTQSAEEAYQLVLKSVGASFKRDTLDERIINDVRNRSGRLIDVQGGYPHGTAYEQTVNAWPALRSVASLKDSDADGMPDDWEFKNGLNANDSSDAGGHKLHKYYTNVEVYMNSLVHQDY
jgi:hypothetical protein